MTAHATIESRKSAPAKDLRVLIVDDDSGVLESIAEAIEDRFKVLTASSGPEALKIVEAEHPEIVLTGLGMSPMIGLELLEKVAAIRPNTRRLLYTEYADIEIVIEQLNRHADKHEGAANFHGTSLLSGLGLQVVIETPCRIN